MSEFTTVNAEPVEVRVGRYSEVAGFHWCEVETDRGLEYLRVDIMAGNFFPVGTLPQDVIGKRLLIEGMHPYFWVAHDLEVLP